MCLTRAGCVGRARRDAQRCLRGVSGGECEESRSLVYVVLHQVGVAIASDCPAARDCRLTAAKQCVTRLYGGLHGACGLGGAGAGAGAGSGTPGASNASSEYDGQTGDMAPRGECDNAVLCR